ncbi:hypothetical protein UPYG_G00048260 [Umbra pygmaea]|uniref:FERM and PDZ domain-containing protein 1 n=1 Tax=Umbra pygmaea TaxID=75934 RepID=A0ABD0XRC0_UMBPY
MEERDRSRSPSRRTSRVEQVVGRWLRRSRESSSRERILGAGESSVQEQRSHPTPLLVQDVTPDGPADGRLVPGDQVVKINNVAVDDLTPEQAADLIRECPDCVLITILRNSVGPKSSFITPEKRAKLRSNPIKVHFAEEVEVNGHSQGNSLLFLPNVLKVYLENGQTKAFKFEPTTTVKDIVMTLKEKLSLCRIEHFSLVLEQQYSITKLVLLHEEEQIQQVVQKKEAHDYRCLFRVCFMPIEPQHLLQDDPTAFEYLYLQSINDVLQERFAVEMRCNTALRLAALHIQERLASCGQSPRNSLKIIMRTWGIENFVSSTLLRNMSEKDLRKAIGYHMKKCQSQDPKQKVLSANQARINYLQELSDLKSFGGKSFSATMMLQDRESMVTLLVGSRYGISQVVNHKLSIMTTLTEFSSITRIELLPESERVSLVKMYLQDIKPITLLLESVAAKDLSCLVAGYCRALVDPRLVIFPWVQDAKHHRVSTEEGYVSHCGSDSDDSTDIDTLMSLVSHSKKRTASDPVGLRRIMEERKEERKEKKKRENEKKEPVEGEKNIKYSTLSPSRKSCEKDRPEMLRDDNRNNKDLKGEGGGDQRNKDPEGSEKEGKASENQGMQEDEREENEKANEDKRQQEEERGREEERGGEEREGTMEEQPSVSEEASDSCRTDSRFMTSISSDSLDLLEEDDLIACSSSLPHFQIHPSSHLTIEPPHPRPYPRGGESSPQGTEHCGGGGRGVASCTNSGSVNSVQLSAIIDPSEHMNYAELSLMLEYLPSPPEASDEEDEDEEKRKREGVSSDSGRPRSSSSSHTDCVFTFEQSDARCYYNICTSVTPDSARSLTHPCTDPLTHSDAEKENGGEEDGQRAVLTLEAVPILQPPPGFSDSSSDEEFFDARDQFVSPEDPKSGAVPIDFSAEMSSGLPDRTVSPSDIRFSLAEGGCKEREGEVSDEGGEKGDREMVPRTSRKRLKKRRSFMETNFTSTVSYPGPDQNQGWDVDQYPDQFQSLTEGSDDTQWLSLDPEPSEQSEIPCPTVSSLIHAEGEASQLESKPIIPKPSQGGAQPWAPSNTDAEFQRSSRSRRQSMETEPDVMESKSVTALVTAASITVVRCRVGPDGKESTDRRGDGEEGAGAGTAPFTSHVFLSEEWEGETGDNGDEKLPMPFSEGPPSGRRSQFNKRPLFIRSEERGKAFFIPQICISPPGVYGRNTEYEESLTPALHTPPCTPIPSLPGPSTSHMVRGVAANLPKDSPVSPTCGLIHQPCSQGIIGQSLSASTLRGKIQSLPLYLSCSQETPTRNASPKPTSKSTLLIASTETENAKDNVVAVAESKGFTQVESDDSEVTPTKPVKVTVEMSGVETARLTMSEVKEVVEKVVMVYGSTPSSEHVCLCANPDPKMSAKLPFIPIAEVETNPPLSSVPVCLEKTSNHETQGSIVHKMATPVTSCSSTPSVPMPIRIDPKSDHEPLSLSNKKFALSSSCPPALVLTTDNLNSTPIRVEPKPNPLHNPLSSGPQMSTSLTSFPSAAVVTTQSLNGPVCVLPSKVGRRTFGGNRDSLCKPPGEEPGLVNTVTTGFKVFPTFTGETQSEWTQTTQAQPGSYPPAKPDFGCSSMLVSGCETVLEGVQAPIEACGCPPPLLYTNCFSGEDSFDDELTVYEFSCRATSPPSSQSPPSSLAFPLMTSTPLTSFLSSSRPSLLSPSFPRSVLPSFSPPELSPLLSPSDCFLSQPSLQDDIGRLRHRHYPPPPAGFQTIRSDVDELLALLQEGRLGGKGGRHPRETCATHFTENKRLLHGEARRLMAGCQTVVRVGQTPDEMLLSLGDSFRTLVGMAGVCLWFSGCDRCDRRNADALAGLADLARTYRDFALAAERASGRRSCHDLSTKLLAKQCTALTASVFCLTQLFRTLTAL